MNLESTSTSTHSMTCCPREDREPMQGWTVWVLCLWGWSCRVCGWWVAGRCLKLPGRGLRRRRWPLLCAYLASSTALTKQSSSVSCRPTYCVGAKKDEWIPRLLILHLETFWNHSTQKTGREGDKEKEEEREGRRGEESTGENTISPNYPGRAWTHDPLILRLQPSRVLGW